MRAVVVVVLAFLGACSPEFTSGDFRCGDAGRGCPDGYDCVGGRCVTGTGPADVGPMDTSTPDGAGDTGDPPDAEPPTDSAVPMDAWMPPPPCGMAVEESATGPGEFGSTNMSIHYFWRFEVTGSPCVCQVGASFSTVDDPSTVIEYGVAPIAGPTADPNSALVDAVFRVAVVPGLIDVASDVSASVDDDGRCLSPGWWALVVRSDVPSARLSSNHTAVSGAQVPSRGGTNEARDRRFYVRFD